MKKVIRENSLLGSKKHEDLKKVAIEWLKSRVKEPLYCEFEIEIPSYLSDKLEIAEYKKSFM
jgi:hypothetical protein